MQPPDLLKTSLAFANVTSALSGVVVEVEVVVVTIGSAVSGSNSCSKLSEGGATSGQVMRGQHCPGTRSIIHLSPIGFTYGQTRR